ncbi:MAG: CBS domain-containing protein [Candidatus Nitrosocaldaceae archaeon]
MDSISTLLEEQLHRIVDKNVTILNADDNVSKAINIMKERNVRCALITYNEEAVGVVTRTDILFKAIAQRKDPNKIKLREIMSSPVIILPASATINDALNVMDKHVIRQIFVGSSSAIVGMVSREGLFEIIHKISKDMNEYVFSGAPVCIINPKAAVVANNTKLKCPYCESDFAYKDELSRHIDRIHLGSGALEGDVRRIFE